MPASGADSSRPDYFFWKPFLLDGGCVIVSPYRAKYRGGVSPRDATAAANVLAPLLHWGSPGALRLEVRDSLRPGMEKQNLLFIGSASNQPLVSYFLRKLHEAGTPLSFSLGSGHWQDSAHPLGQNLIPKYVTDDLELRPEALDLGADFCVEDFGLIGCAPNPNDPTKVVTFVGGIHGYGTLAASQVFREERFQKEIDAALRDRRLSYEFDAEVGRDRVVEAVVRASISGDTADLGQPVRSVHRMTVDLVRVGSRWDRQIVLNNEIWTYRLPTPRKLANPHRLSLFFTEGEAWKSLFHLEGRQSRTAFCEIGFSESDCDAYDRRVSSALRESRGWEKEIKRIGQELSRELQPALHLAPTNLRHSDLVWRFGGPSHLLRLPLEATRIQNDLSYLALVHPVVRSINGLVCTRKPPDSELIDSLRSKGERLQVLLVASDPLGDLPAAEAEVQQVARILGSFHDRIEVRTLTGSNATAEAFAARLGADSTHILHFAGHAHWDRDNPRESYFLFRNARGSTTEIFVEQVGNWIGEDSPLCFCYLSSCSGTRAGDAIKELTYDFYGIADSLVRTGIPAVLGFRENIKDASAQKLAEYFYGFLCTSRSFSLSEALLRTRRLINTELKREPSWLMPILVLQH